MMQIVKHYGCSYLKGILNVTFIGSDIPLGLVVYLARFCKPWTSEREAYIKDGSWPHMWVYEATKRQSMLILRTSFSYIVIALGAFSKELW